MRVVVSWPPPIVFSMLEAFGVSAAIVALAEIGDKTQLLAIVLAAKFRKPVPILMGILAATVLNHALAAIAGYFIADLLSGEWFRIAVGVGFIVMAAWALIPDKEEEGAADRAHGGVFLTTLVAFFLVEIGDKTQIATTLLAARFHDIAAVTAGTTLGMMAVNAPAVYFGKAAARFAPLHYVRIVAACLFALIGAWLIAVALGLMPG
jgi:putative Ca2+/H+ antiporter (TMEM165/GDT1 family)